MPTILSCPEIARRIGYSRMHVTRMARQNEIPGEQIITKGGQFRYELTPELAEWIRVMRARPRNGHVLSSDFRLFQQRRRLTERGKDGALIVEEIAGFLKEIEKRVDELLNREPDPTPEEVELLSKTLFPTITGLMRMDTIIRKHLADGFFDPPTFQTLLATKMPGASQKRNPRG